MYIDTETLYGAETVHCNRISLIACQTNLFSRSKYDNFHPRNHLKNYLGFSLQDPEPTLTTSPDLCRMSDPQLQASDASQFKNGNDIHFDYNNGDKTVVNTPSSSSNKKKKKKKNKNKLKTVSRTDVQATINDPDVDYPTSRVIKQAPNGDVIVESLDDEPTDKHDHHSSSPSANIWDNSTIEEQENLKSFWESLDEPQKMELVKIDKKSIMEIFKKEAKSLNYFTNHHSSHNSSSANGSHGNNQNANPNHCTCSYCGRKTNIIESELENIYDNHFDDIIDFIHEVRDINDLYALPGLLFGGFHMLEEEHKLVKRQQRELHQLKQKHSIQRDQVEEELKRRLQNGNNHSHSHSHSHYHDCNHHHDEEDEEIDDYSDENDEHYHEHSHSHSHSQLHDTSDEIDEFLDKIQEIDEEEEDIPRENSNEHEHVHDHVPNTAELKQSLSEKQKNIRRILEPALFEALKKFGINDEVSNSQGDLNKDELIQFQNQGDILKKAIYLKTHMHNLNSADRLEVEGILNLITNMAKLFVQNNKNSQVDKESFEGLTFFADEFMKTDGNAFIDMIESLTESRTKREDLLREMNDSSFIERLEAERQMKNLQISEQINEVSEEPQPPVLEHNFQGHHHHDHEHQEFEDEDGYDDEEYEEEEEEEDDNEEDEDELDEGELSDTESEISEEEKMQEIRRLFLIQVIKLFQERLKNSYKEKLSQDRTKSLIEELEAEENAKKERENKKLRQKEKAKEKKRLQQLAKEEEKRKKEEEQRLKEEEVKRKQEELRLEQKRKKEEAKLKREEEKRKRIEELKRKELENQKRIELQRKKEEEAKKLKEERKKKLEEERKQKEEEKKQKELLKKQREEERRREKKLQEQQELQQRQEQEALKLLQEQEKARLAGLETHTEAEALRLANDEQLRASPAKNHILDQLYQAKPRSMSSSAASTPIADPAYNLPDLTNNFIPSVNSPSLASQILPGAFNQVNLNPGINTFNQIPPQQQPQSQQQAPPPQWDNSQLLNGTLPGVLAPTVQTVTPQQFNNGFSPFNNGLVDANNGNAFGAANPAGATGNSSVWGSTTSSRNNSIWGKSSSISHAAPSSSLWNNLPSTIGGSLPEEVPAPAPAGGSTLLNGSSEEIPVDSNLIQTGAYEAFLLLQNSNQLEFGVAPNLKLYQMTKTVISNPQLTIHQFLNSCRNYNNNGYRFDFIYDDMGTITHIKVSLTGFIPQLQPGGTPSATTPVKPVVGGAATTTSSPPGLMFMDPAPQLMPSIPRNDGINGQAPNVPFNGMSSLWN